MERAIQFIVLSGLEDDHLPEQGNKQPVRDIPLRGGADVIHVFNQYSKYDLPPKNERLYLIFSIKQDRVCILPCSALCGGLPYCSGKANMQVLIFQASSSSSKPPPSSFHHQHYHYHHQYTESRFPFPARLNCPDLASAPGSWPHAFRTRSLST